MDKLGKLEALFERACQGPTPIFHVGENVIAEIAARGSIRLTPLSFVAGLSAAAAAIALFYAISGWMTLSGSVVDYFDPAVLDALL